MYILGISCYYHDSAVALLKNGQLIAAAQEERFSRKKHDSSFPDLAIEFCLHKADIKAGDLDYIVFYEKPLLKFERLLLSSLSGFPKSWKLFGESMINWFEKKLWIKSKIQRKFDVSAEHVLFIDHHDAHAASAFFCSPFDEAAILTVDGVGEWTTTALGIGKADWKTGADNAIELSQEQQFPHSLGLLYSAFTAFLGFRVNNGEYKVMGMAPYGKPRFLDDIYDNILYVNDDGGFSLNMDYLSYHHSIEKSFSQKFVELFGEPRKPESEFITPLVDPERCDPSSEIARKNQHYADIAASIQRAMEETLLKILNGLHRKTGMDKLCMAGGVALNSMANGRIKQETSFKEIYIQPAAGDAGGALGAALYTWHVLLGKPRSFVMEHTFYGQEYSRDESINALNESGLSFTKPPSQKDLVNNAVSALIEGKVVALFQGRFEWGPRALGNRTILGDPRSAEMKDIINKKIKFREPFRPFAPVVPETKAQDYFENADGIENYYPARFMLSVIPWKEEAQELAPAVNHMGTGRIQTIRREWNPLYYDILQEFGDRTGVYILVNTSFNLKGEPIVSSPADAIKTFKASGIEHLVLGDLWV